MTPARLPHATTSLCAVCLGSVPARIEQRGDTVWLAKVCPVHGPAEVLLSPDAAWYLATVAVETPRSPPAPPLRPAEQGCPYDCGPCTQHEMRLQLPIVPITAACNLDCPICYTHNHNSGGWHLSEADLDRILDHLRRLEPGRRIINLTGGEPTQHPAFARIVQRCAEAGIHRITVSTHGLRFLQDPWLLPLLAAVDARVVLSFDSFTDAANRTLLGGNLASAKMQVLALLEQHGISTTLLPVLARGVNEAEVGQFLQLALQRDFIRSVELHTMTFTGQSGSDFARSARLTPYDVLRAIETQTHGALRLDDFVPAPAAHPLCYQVAYLLRLADGRWLPFARFMPKGAVRAMLGGLLYLEPGPEVDAVLQDAITQLYAGATVCADTPHVLAALKALLAAFYAAAGDAGQRLRVCERATKAIYIHAHMDAETFDSDRIRQCCVGIVEPDGRSVPSCAYNIVYRNRDARFAAVPLAPVQSLGIGSLR